MRSLSKMFALFCKYVLRRNVNKFDHAPAYIVLFSETISIRCSHDRIHSNLAKVVCWEGCTGVRYTKIKTVWEVLVMRNQRASGAWLMCQKVMLRWKMTCRRHLLFWDIISRLWASRSHYKSKINLIKIKFLINCL